MAALKDIYTVSFFNDFSNVVEMHHPIFNRHKFITSIFDNEWQGKALKQRMRHTTNVLHQHLPSNFIKAAQIIEKTAITLIETNTNQNIFGYMFLPDYIEVYGLAHFKTSIRAIETVTQFVSCEYAVRPFIVQYPKEMIQQMHNWSLHKSHHVRRLACEGTRPRLPWAAGIDFLKQNPKPIIPILDNLKNDASEYVRRSVANNLNDISKNQPDIVLELVKKWSGISKETDSILKHGSRTLLKNGNKTILKHFGVSSNPDIYISNLKITTPQVETGDYLKFNFEIKNQSTSKHAIRIEYAIHYLLQNGQLSKKVFKISERVINEKTAIEIIKQHSFKVITTRKFYKGQHALSIIINGKPSDLINFELV